MAILFSVKRETAILILVKRDQDPLLPPSLLLSNFFFFLEGR